ncbi:RNA polymerase sigma factor [Pendulispora albinea]|uniref:RNA polymerase sigma factor n=1 Tax=Pendulispora albinea TaxID=2741071 RepID=A0ABZ2LRR6_9BACT
MRAYVAGDAAAFDELFRRHAPALGRMLRRGLTSDDAGELLQQTFLQVHRSRHDFRAGARVAPWFYTIALNVKRQHLRTLRRRGLREDRTGEDIDAVPAPQANPPAHEPRIASMLAELPPEQREILELHYVEELPFQRVAEKIGISVGAVRVRAHRAYLRLRATFAGSAGEADAIDAISETGATDKTKKERSKT